MLNGNHTSNIILFYSISNHIIKHIFYYCFRLVILLVYISNNQQLLATSSHQLLFPDLSMGAKTIIYAPSIYTVGVPLLPQSLSHTLSLLADRHTFNGAWGMQWDSLLSLHLGSPNSLGSSSLFLWLIFNKPNIKPLNGVVFSVKKCLFEHDYLTYVFVKVILDNSQIAPAVFQPTICLPYGVRGETEHSLLLFPWAIEASP